MNVSRLLRNDEFVKRSLIRRFLLGHVPQAAAFNQAVEIFRKICSVIPSALQGLCHEQHFKMRMVAERDRLRQMLLEQGMTDSVDLLVHLQHLASALQIERGEAFMNQV